MGSVAWGGELAPIGLVKTMGGMQILGGGSPEAPKRGFLPYPHVRGLQQGLGEKPGVRPL